MTNSYNFTAIRSGRMLETYLFSLPIQLGLAGGGSGGKKVISKTSPIDVLEPERDYRKEHLGRVKRNIERITFCNFDNKYTSLITLTYRANITDLDIANKDFNKFIMRLNYTLQKLKRPALKYICRPEFQERGAIHYHLVTNLRSFPFTPDVVREWRAAGTLPDAWKDEYNIRDLWHGKEAGKGMINLEPIKKGMFSVCSYLTDYLTKQTDDKLQQRKSFFTSRELDKPEQYYDSDAMQVFEQVEKSAKKIGGFCFEPENTANQKIIYAKFIID